MTAGPIAFDPARLLSAARDGDPNALGELLEGHRQYLTLLARLHLGRVMRVKVGASDVVQETFLEANRDFVGFQGTTSAAFAGWLRRVMARNLANQVRRYRGTHARDVALERSLTADIDRSSERLGATLPAPQSSPSHAAARAEAAIRLADALAQLPEDYRQALVLRNLEDLSFPEVAERMERSVDSVKKLWARGLAQLRRLLPETTDA